MSGTRTEPKRGRAIQINTPAPVAVEKRHNSRRKTTENFPDGGPTTNI